MDGEIPFKDANVHLLSHTLHYGLGAFEGIRSYKQHDGGGGVFKLDEHVERLMDSARMCRMKMPFTKEEIVDACLKTLEANEFQEGYIRPLVFLGHGMDLVQEPICSCCCGLGNGEHIRVRWIAKRYSCGNQLPYSSSR